jgi:hypothetical protein
METLDDLLYGIKKRKKENKVYMYKGKSNNLTF